MHRLAALCLLLSAVFGAGQSQLIWSRVQPDPASPLPSARRQMALAYDPNADALYMFGGTTGQPLNDLWMYTFSTRMWLQVHGPRPASDTSTPRPRFSIIAGFYSQGSDGLFLISTGEGDRKVFFNDIWAFNTTSRLWTELPSRGDVPTERYGAAGGMHINGTALYVTHGFSNRRFSDTVYYDMTRMRWVEVFAGANKYSNTEPHPRCLLGSTLVGPDQPAFFGGCLSGGFSGGPCPAADSWVFRGGEWERLDDCAAPRQHGGMAAWPGRLGTAVMFGGRETDRSIIMSKKSEANEVDFVDTATGKWRRLATSGANGSIPALRSQLGMVAVSNGVVIFGGDRRGVGSFNDLWLLTGNPDGAASVGDCGPTWFLYMHLHGFFMIISWGILLLAGVFVARYFRHIGPLWFKIHQICQIGGASLSILGIILVFPGTRALPNFAHGLIGVLILIFSIQQIINGFMRPHKEPDTEPAPRRIYWEHWHKWGGRLFLVLGVINISLGVFLIIAPTGVIVVWFLIFAGWLAAFVIFEIRLQLKGDATK